MKKNKQEANFWNKKGCNYYFDKNNKPIKKFIDSKVSDYQFKKLKEINFDFKNKEVLEIGVGLGRDLQKFQDLGAKLNGLDISKKFIKNINNLFNGLFIVSDVRQIDKVFFKKVDLIYSRWSLVHLYLDEFESILIKFLKILNKEGIVLISLRWGNNYKAISPQTKLQSLELNKTKIKQIIGKEYKILLSEKIYYPSNVWNKKDKQFTIILQKN